MVSQQEWANKLKDLVQKGGGSTCNGWTVQIKLRPSGRREIRIRSKQGRSYRSIAQASIALAEGQGKGKKSAAKLPNGKSPIKVVLKSKNNQLEGGSKVKSPGSKRHKAEGSAGEKKRRKKESKNLDGMGNEIGAVQDESVTEHPVFAKLLGKARLHVSRIRREMDILEVYDAEGWRGSNRDKLKPRAEMQRAHKQMNASKEILREIVRRCEEGEGTAIPATDYDSDGGLDNSKIFCAICGNNVSTDSNDIVLCDGPCHRAYHEKCCIPNCTSADLDEEADWLCPACYTKDEVHDLLNEEFGTSYEIDHPSEDLMNDELFVRGDSTQDQASLPATGTWANLLGGSDLVSSDTDDNSYRGGLDEENSEPKADCEGAHISRTPSNSSSSSHESCSSDSRGMLHDKKRRRARVDYVAMNSEMFGEEEEEEEDSDRDYG